MTPNPAFQAITCSPYAVIELLLYICVVTSENSFNAWPCGIVQLHLRTHITFRPSIAISAGSAPIQSDQMLTYFPCRCLCFGFSEQMIYTCPFPDLPPFLRTLCITNRQPVSQNSIA